MTAVAVERVVRTQTLCWRWGLRHLGRLGVGCEAEGSAEDGCLLGWGPGARVQDELSGRRGLGDSCQGARGSGVLCYMSSVGMAITHPVERSGRRWL